MENKTNKNKKQEEKEEKIEIIIFTITLATSDLQCDGLGNIIGSYICKLSRLIVYILGTKNGTWVRIHELKETRKNTRDLREIFRGRLNIGVAMPLSQRI